MAATTMEDGGEGARATDLEERRAERAREREGEWQVGEWQARRPSVGEAQALSPRPGVAGEVGPAGTAPL